MIKKQKKLSKLYSRNIIIKIIYQLLEIAKIHLNDNSLKSEYRKWLEDQYPKLLTSAAWTRIQSGECEKAIDLLHNTLEHEQNILAIKGLAICYLRKQNFFQAEEFFDIYLSRKKDDINMKILYTDLMESMGDFKSAIQILKPLEEDVNLPEDKKSIIANKLKSMIHKDKEYKHQVTATSPHFTLIYRAEEHDNLVADILEELEYSLDEFISTWKMIPPKNPIEVILYPEKNFRNLVPSSPKWARGIYDGRIRIPFYEEYHKAKNIQYLKRIIRHELAHAILTEMVNRKDLPTWLNEGIAQFLECQDGCKNFEFPQKRGRFLPQKLLSGSFIALNSLKARKAYKQSLYLLYTLERGKVTNRDRPIADLISTLPHSTKLTNESILSKIGLSFPILYKKAQSSWTNGIQYKN